VKQLFTAYNYLLYLTRSKNRHGVHSPFVYDLLTEVVYNKTDYYAYGKVEGLREKLLDSKQELYCKDLGAGPAKKGGKKRSVADLVNHSAKSPKFGQLLFRLVNYFQPENILELGTSLGISAAYMAMADSRIQLVTIEGCEEIAVIAEKNFCDLELKNIELIQGNFDEVLPTFLKNTPKTEFVFFDGNHRKEATLSYFQQCLAKADDTSVFIFDDIYWSAEMKEAWNEIKDHPKVKITLDLFYLGIVFFRKEQVKEHFVIKF